MCLHIVRSDYGEAVANTVARRLVIAPHREGDQAQFIEQPCAPRGRTSRFSRLLDDFLERISQSLSVFEMAASPA